jgi:Tfp pilus assembly protein PilF
MACGAAGNSGLLGAMRLARQCRKELDAAAELDPNYADALWSQMIFYFRAPGMAGGSKAEARKVATRLQAVNPARGAEAFAFMAEGASREQFFLKAVELAPERYESRTRLADFYSSDGKNLDLAEKQAREALRLDPGRVDSYAILARVYAAQRHWAELEQILTAGELETIKCLMSFDSHCYYPYRKSRSL